MYLTGLSIILNLKGFQKGKGVHAAAADDNLTQTITKHWISEDTSNSKFMKIVLVKTFCGLKPWENVVVFWLKYCWHGMWVSV